jgi:uncharacterized integral membrane protein
MSKNVLTALVLIALTVIVLLFNTKSSVSVELLLFQVRGATAALVFLGFTAVGVTIGVLLR